VLDGTEVEVSHLENWKDTWPFHRYAEQSMETCHMLIRFCLCLCLLACSPINAETVLSDDGREVLLNDDGSWEYVSGDRFATRDDGSRIRLSEDGSWQEVADERKWVQARTLSKDRFTDGAYSFELVEVQIESVRSTQQKNTRVRSQILLTINVTSQQHLPPIELARDVFKVSDSKGRVYPVTDVSLKTAEHRAGETMSIRVIAAGAPRWWGVKYFRLEIDPGTVGNATGLVLIKAMSAVLKKEVKALSF